jgi:hypothetical protein
MTESGITEAWTQRYLELFEATVSQPGKSPAGSILPSILFPATPDKMSTSQISRSDPDPAGAMDQYVSSG